MLSGSRWLSPGPACAAVVAALLGSCKAEYLGVDVPRGGPASISQEDLQRDVFALADGKLGSRAPGQTGHGIAMEHVSDRLERMHTVPAFGRSDRGKTGAEGGEIVCRQREGRSGKALVLAASDGGVGAADAGGMAAVISVAKAFDITDLPQHTMVFCAWPAEGGLDGYLSTPAAPLDQTLRIVVLGSMDGASLGESSRLVEAGTGTVEVLSVNAGVEDWHGTPDDRMERLDYTRMLQRVREVVDLLATGSR